MNDPHTSEPLSFDGWRGEIASDVLSGNAPESIARLIDPSAAVETLHWGRNYLYTARLENPRGPITVVVKQFRHDTGKARLRRRFSGSKAERSWRVARALQVAGIPTPEPLVWLDSAELGGPSFFVTRYLDTALEARYLMRAMNAGRHEELFPGIDIERVLRALGEMLRRLHDAQFWHRDMTSGNILLVDGALDCPPPAPQLYLLDLNRTRMGRRLSTSERLRDLGRLPIFRRGHQQILFDSYWGGATRARGLKWAVFTAHHRGFLLKNRSKQGVRGGLRRGRDLLLPRRPAHEHIPPPEVDASPRDKVVWDELSDQPHQHASRFEKTKVRLRDARSHLASAAVVTGAVPRVHRRYRELSRSLYRESVPWQGVGICVRPWPRAPAALVDALEGLGVHRVLLRLHPWQQGHGAEEALAHELVDRGYELAFALPQTRELVRDRERWRQSVTDLAECFAPLGRVFQVGQAVNRSKWGVWTAREYLDLLEDAERILRARRTDVEIMGPAVIDFEFHVTASLLNQTSTSARFDIVSSLLYVDRRGAPENRQLGLDTVHKMVLLKALASTARNCPSGRSWITEVNWPLREGPHSPAGRDVAVDEESQANYLVRYYLLALTSGMVERVYWWQLIAKGYGLVDPGPTGSLRRRPAFQALATLDSQLAGSVSLGPLPTPRSAWLWQFRRPDGTRILVGWSSGRVVEVELPAAPSQAFSRDGGDIEYLAGSRLAMLHDAPVYFIVPAAEEPNASLRRLEEPTRALGGDS